MKCTSGWKSLGDRCVRTVRGSFSNISSSRNKEISWSSAIIAVLIFISLWFTTISGLERAGFVYFAIFLFVAFVYVTPAFRDNLAGFRFDKWVVILGISIPVGYVILSSIFPTFSLLTPAISLSVDAGFKYFIILFVAPLGEEYFRSASFAFIYKNFKVNFITANIIQATLFALVHVSAYGIGLKAYDSFIQLWGALTAISMALLSAFVFGFISGIAINQTNNIVPSQIAHFSVNAWLVRKGLYVAS